MTLKKTLKEIAQKRFDAIEPSEDADDLKWVCTCREWKTRDEDPSPLLLLAAQLLRSGTRLPKPLAQWLADAFEASMIKPPEVRARELAIELGLQRREGRRPVHLPDGRLLRMERLSVRRLAKKYRVGVATIQKRLNEARATPAEIEALTRGVVIARKFFKQ